MEPPNIVSEFEAVGISRAKGYAAFGHAVWQQGIVAGIGPRASVLFEKGDNAKRGVTDQSSPLGRASNPCSIVVHVPRTEWAVARKLRTREG